MSGFLSEFLQLACAGRAGFGTHGAFRHIEKDRCWGRGNWNELWVLSRTSGLRMWGYFSMTGNPQRGIEQDWKGKVLVVVLAGGDHRCTGCVEEGKA